MIARFLTRCRVSRQHQGVVELADHIVRERFASELSHFLGPSLSSQPEIVRIRHLHIRLRISTVQLGEDLLLRAWLVAFGRELFTALAYPTGAGPVEIVRSDSSAAYVAAFLGDLLAGVAEQRWQYEEFRELLALAPYEAATRLLLEHPAGITPILMELASLEVLPRLLARLDDLALERLFIALAESAGTQWAELTVDDVLGIAHFVMEHPAIRGIAFASRQHALALFVVAAKSGKAWSPRQMFHALTAIQCLMADPGLLTAAPQLIGGVEERIGRTLPPAVIGILSRIASLAEAAATGTDLSQQRVFSALRDVLNTIGSQAPSSLLPGLQPAVSWLQSDCAGLFLLASVIDCLGWARDSQTPRFLLSGIALAMLDRFDLEIQRLDPTVQVFAGFGGEPDLVGLRAFFKSACQEIESCADQLVRAFAERIRGFRKASRPAIMRQFIKTPGRIRVEEARVLVVLAPSPFHVALRISGMDTPVEAVSWLQNRRLEFLLEGL